MKKVSLSLLFIMLLLPGISQDTLYIRSLLKQILDQQVITDPYFVSGAFPSYLCNAPEYCEEKRDNNVFYNALIGYTLNSLKPALPVRDQNIIDSIRIRSQNLFPHFKNAKGRTTYNFARTDTAFKFPFNNWIPKLRGDLAFPDDLDCTALVMLSTDAPDTTIREVHRLMQGYVNSNKTRTTYRSYRDIPAYSAWFGKKFPVVLDVSVLCNILCFVQENDLKWTAADSASLRLIIKTIEQNDHKKHPSFVSPYYPKHSLILYHLARLMNVKPIAELEALKPLLAKEAQTIIDKSDNELECVMLNSALIKWGEKPIKLSMHYKNLWYYVHSSDFSFFAGNIPSYMKQPVKGLLTKTKTLQYYYYCSAFNDVLLLEYLVLSQGTE